jgi:hypothetical protein
MEVSVFSVQVSGQMEVSVFSFQRFRFYSLTPETRHLTPQKPGFGACILEFKQLVLIIWDFICGCNS